MSNVDTIARDNDTDGGISYHEPAQWARSPSLGGPQNLLSHQTSATFAYVRFAFTGSYVAYYSDMGPDRGDYEVELDGDIAQRASAYSSTLIQGQQLFSSRVTPGVHTLRVTNQPGGKVMGVRYFSYRPVDVDSSAPKSAAPPSAPTDLRSQPPIASTGGTQTSETSLPCERTSTPAVDGRLACAGDRRPSTGHIPLIVGLLCGLLVLSLVALVLVLMYRRLRRKRRLVPLPRMPEQEPQPPPYTREKPPTVFSSHNPGKASQSVVSSNYTA